jgi:fimbrial chaperone protein
MRRAVPTTAFLLLWTPLLLSSAATAGEFRVTPITLTFERGVKSGVITIQNETEEPLQLQVKAYEWTQDENGKDHYTETNDLIFFPRMMSLTKTEERILRAGIKAPAGAQEKTYRLFIEEIPGPRQEASGTEIRVAIRLAVPIFVKPERLSPQGRIDRFGLSDGQLQAVVQNTGNTHFVIDSVILKGLDEKGTETLSKELSGWYLLAGATRAYQTPLTAEVCRDTARFEVEVKTSGFTLRDKLDAAKSLCLP